jgi:hypothetical protein
MLRWRTLIATGVVLHAAPSFTAIEHQNVAKEPAPGPQPVLTTPLELREFVYAEYPADLERRQVSGAAVQLIDCCQRLCRGDRKIA